MCCKISGLDILFCRYLKIIKILLTMDTIVWNQWCLISLNIRSRFFSSSSSGVHDRNFLQYYWAVSQPVLVGISIFKKLMCRFLNVRVCACVHVCACVPVFGCVCVRWSASDGYAVSPMLLLWINKKWWMLSERASYGFGGYRGRGLVTAGCTLRTVGRNDGPFGTQARKPFCVLRSNAIVLCTVGWHYGP